MSVLLNNSDDYIGVAYAITNSQGITSYLIGTCHAVDYETIKHPCFKKIVEKCSVLFTEMGTNLFINSNDGSLPELSKQDIPYPYSLDTYLTLSAWSNKIPIYSLDKHVPELQKNMDLSRTLCEELGPDMLDQLLLDKLANSQRGLNLNIAHDKLTAFKNGYLDDLAANRESILFFASMSSLFSSISNRKKKELNDMTDVLITKREEKWSEILIPQLKETNKSLCIAVGVTHVVGKNSLSERFAKNNLKVELLTKYRSRL